MALVVAQPVLNSVGRAFSACCQMLKLLDRPIPGHLKINADAAIEGAHGEVQVDIRYSSLDYLGQHLVGLLVVSDPNLDGMLGGDPVLHTGRQLFAHLRWELVELVNLAPVLVVDWHTWLLSIGRVTGIGRDDKRVEEFVECFVVVLKAGASGGWLVGTLQYLDWNRSKEKLAARGYIFGSVLIPRETYLGHAASEGYSSVVEQDALGANWQVYSVIGVLADQSPQLGFNLELDVTGGYLSPVRVVQDVQKQEVCDSLGHVFVRTCASNAWLPRPEGALRSRRCRGRCWSGCGCRSYALGHRSGRLNGRYRASFVGRSLPARSAGLAVDLSDMVVDNFP